MINCLESIWLIAGEQIHKDDSVRIDQSAGLAFRTESHFAAPIALHDAKKGERINVCIKGTMPVALVGPYYLVPPSDESLELTEDTGDRDTDGSE